MRALTIARQRLINIKRAAQGALMEAPGLLSLGDPDNELTAAQGGSFYFRRLTQDSVRNLQPYDQDRMIEIGAYLYQSNPVAKRLIERRTNYALGDDFTLSAEDDKAQEVLDDWWQHDGWDQRVLSTINGWQAYGELLLPVTVNAADGRVGVGFLSNSKISVVHHAPGNMYDLTYVELKSSGAGPGSVWRIIGPDRDPTSDTYGELRGLSPQQREALLAMRLKAREMAGQGRPVLVALPWEGDKPGAAPRLVGECFYFPANRLPDQTRGISTLYPIADYLESYETLIWNMTERAAIANNIIGVMKHEGLSQDEVDAQAARWGDTLPASLSMVHLNEKSSFELASPKLVGEGASEYTDIVLSVISTGVGFPKYWINATDDPNRANAEAMAGPVLRDMEEFQREVKLFLETMGNFVLQMAKLYKKLSGDKLGLTADLPALGDKRAGEAGTVLQAVAAAIVGLRTEKLLDKETAIRSVVTAVRLLGVDVTYEEVEKRLEAEAEEDEKEKEKEGDQPFGPPQPPPPPGQQQPGQQPGQPPQNGQQPPPPPPQGAVPPSVNGKGAAAKEAMAHGLLEALGIPASRLNAERVADAFGDLLFGPGAAEPDLKAVREAEAPVEVAVREALDRALAEHPGHSDQKVHGRKGGGGGASAPSAGGVGSGGGPDVRSLAQAVHERALKLEPAVTAAIVGVVSTAKGQMVGLHHRLKKPDAIVQKIERKVRQGKFGSIEESASKDVDDSIRYTVKLPHNGYAAGAKAVLSALDKAGWEPDGPKGVENSWLPTSSYRGVNAILRHRETGAKAEVQFHTATSLKVKDKMHPVYNKARVMPESPEKRLLYQKMKKMWDGHEIPPGSIPGVLVVK